MFKFINTNYIFIKVMDLLKNKELKSNGGSSSVNKNKIVLINFFAKFDCFLEINFIL